MIPKMPPRGEALDEAEQQRAHQDREARAQLLQTVQTEMYQRGGKPPASLRPIAGVETMAGLLRYVERALDEEVSALVGKLKALDLSLEVDDAVRSLTRVGTAWLRVLRGQRPKPPFVPAELGGLATYVDEQLRNERVALVGEAEQAIVTAQVTAQNRYNAWAKYSLKHRDPGRVMLPEEVAELFADQRVEIATRVTHDASGRRVINVDRFDIPPEEA